MLLFAGCNRVAALLPIGALQGGPTAPDGFDCPWGASYVLEAPGAGEHRTFPDTEVHGCRDDGLPVGPHLERWPGGGVAVEGSWAGGERDGVWLAWYPDGAFRWQASFVKGVEHGVRREVGTEGRVVEIAMSEGLATGLLTLVPDAPMPEWDGGQRVEGTRYRSHSGR